MYLGLIYLNKFAWNMIRLNRGLKIQYGCQLRTITGYTNCNDWSSIQIASITINMATLDCFNCMVYLLYIFLKITMITLKSGIHCLPWRGGRLSQSVGVNMPRGVNMLLQIYIFEIPHRGTYADDGIFISRRITIEDINGRIIISELFPQTIDQSCKQIHLK